MTRKRMIAVLLAPLLALAAATAWGGSGQNLDDPFLMGGSPGAMNIPDGQKLPTDLAAQLPTLADSDRLAVIVETTVAPTSTVLASMQAAVGPFTTRFVWTEVLFGFAATLTKAQIQGLLARADVVQIEPDRPYYPLLDTATLYTGVQKARQDFGVTGKRVAVAVVDTGIDGSHVDFQGKIVAWKDTSGDNTTSPNDSNGHGSHVAGIVAGSGRGDARYTGVAPDAKLVGVKVFPSTSPFANSSAIIEGIEWIVKNKDAYNIVAANLSLGSIIPCSDGKSANSKAVDNAASRKGVTMVIAAGNAGPGPCTVSSPGDARLAVTVGNNIDPGTASASKRGWGLAISSSRGPTADGRVKPDVIAPGTAIMAVATGTGTGYTAKSGTSMASPFVAGVVALMKEAGPGLKPDKVKRILMETATPWGPARPNQEYGWGMLNAYQAVKAAGEFPTGQFDLFGIRHDFIEGSLAGDLDAKTYRLTVTDTSTPLAMTLVIADWQAIAYRSANGVRVSEGTPNFDLELYDPAGTLVSLSPCAAGYGCTVNLLTTNTERQEQIRYLPKVTGDYTLKVVSRGGGGRFFLDVSRE